MFFILHRYHKECCNISNVENLLILSFHWFARNFVSRIKLQKMKFSCFLLNNTKQSISCLVSQLFLAVSVQCITETSHGIKGFSFLQMSEEYLKNIAAIGHGKSRDDVTLSSAEIQGILFVWNLFSPYFFLIEINFFLTASIF